MRGPIDYIIVGFEGNKFDGSILRALGSAIESGAINLIGLSFIQKDKQGAVTSLDLAEVGDGYLAEFASKYDASEQYTSEDDMQEVAELLAEDSSAGLLVVEQLWAKPLRESLIHAKGYLIAEGRIHPEAAKELEMKGA